MQSKTKYNQERDVILGKSAVRSAQDSSLIQPNNQPKKYVPPHMRQTAPSQRSKPKRFPAPDSQRDHHHRSRPRRSGYESSKSRFPSGGGWHGTRTQYPTMERDPRLEAKLFPSLLETTTGINFDKYQDVDVNVTGKDIPAPIDRFTDGKFHEVLLSNIGLAGYETPTPIQKHSIPITLSRRDLMACAQTGSGKTGAFLFPVLSLLLTTQAQRSPPDHGYRSTQYPSALILSPTRELAHQIHHQASKFIYRTGLRAVCVYGGQPMRDQIRLVQKGCDLVIATPGRLVDMLQRGILSVSRLKFLIFDEADQMLDMGFERDIRSIVQDFYMPPQCQTSMFSATFPKTIQRLAADFLDNYIFLAVGRVGDASENITQAVIYTHDQAAKDKELMRLLSQADGLTIVFVETKRSADWLETWLLDECKVNAIAIHGDRDQHERDTALRLFRQKKCPVLVATSVAARGLDIPNVNLVINYDLPSKFEDYIHRIGRTGRAGHRGDAVAFVDERSKHLDQLLTTLEDSKQVIESWFRQMVHSNQRSGRGYQGRPARRNTRGTARDFRESDDSTRRGSSFSSSARTNAWGSFSYNQTEPTVTSPSFNTSRASGRAAASSKSSAKQEQSDSDSEGCNDAW